MKLNIAVAAEGFAKGGRVVVKAAKDEWYMGTVASSASVISVGTTRVKALGPDGRR